MELFIEKELAFGYESRRIINAKHECFLGRGLIWQEIYLHLKIGKLKKKRDSEFLAASKELEPGYQVARLRMMRGLTQAQLAEMVGTRQPSIARLKIARAFQVYFF